MAELALTIAMNLIPSIRPSRDSSYHAVDPKEGLAVAWRSREGVLAQQVFSPPLLRLCHAHHHLLPHHHHRTTTTTRQHTKTAEANLNIAANKLVIFLTASRYRGGHGSEARLAEVKAFPRTQMAITSHHAPSLHSCQHTDMQHQTPSARRRRLHRGARAAKGRRRRRHGGRHGPAGLSAGTGLAHQLWLHPAPCRSPALHHRCIQSRQVSSSMLKGC
jgi:hypothetical protein